MTVSVGEGVGDEMPHGRATGEASIKSTSLHKVGETKGAVFCPHAPLPSYFKTGNYCSENIPVDSSLAKNIDDRDKNSPDNWISRHPEMVRLTGKHPFNSEPPLSGDISLTRSYLTSQERHYVRNHGAVPRLQWDQHTIRVGSESSCANKKSLIDEAAITMDDLLHQFPIISRTATLVCAGNRRKEQNMVKQSKGFSWGAGAIGTAVWTGVPLCEFLKALNVDYVYPTDTEEEEGVDTVKQLHVRFEGADRLPNGYYGTSIPLDVAMDPSNDVMLAFGMNGSFLSPDHGFPVRCIIPGYVGGRMVKWVSRITISDEESDNWYHYYDNRVLPAHVDLDLASREHSWWRNPDYIINEMNINSVITFPDHMDRSSICGGDSDPKSDTQQRFFTISGYAYSGGGRKVTRVELTFNNGKSWHLCELDHGEGMQSRTALRRGKFWGWCLWKLLVPFDILLGSSEIAVRAVDASMNMQPSDITWNVLGMMSNAWFRVKVHQREGELVFEHPTSTRPDNPGGWMQLSEGGESNKTELDTNSAALVQEANKLSVSQSLDTGESIKKDYVLKEQALSHSFPDIDKERLFTVDEVLEKGELKTDDSCWIIANSGVYRIPGKFLRSEHPGGYESIAINAGMDCTEEFNAIHSSAAEEILEQYRIGT
eukprot:Nk52_evm1s227 gene=Nk52_evmTU1s227